MIKIVSALIGFQVLFAFSVGSVAFSPQAQAAPEVGPVTADEVTALRADAFQVEVVRHVEAARDVVDDVAAVPVVVMDAALSVPVEPEISAAGEEAMIVAHMSALEEMASLAADLLPAAAVETSLVPTRTISLSDLPAGAAALIDDAVQFPITVPIRPPEPEVAAFAFGVGILQVFPVVGGGEYSSSFGAPRPEGRTHMGNDIFAEKMTPVVAVAAGTVVRASKEPGEKCCSVRLQHEDGSQSLYIHLNNDTPGTDDGLGWGLADGIVKGASVEAGQVIGYVGDSGNAEETPPHLHFEYHPPSANAVDPHQLLDAAPVMEDVNTPISPITVEGELPYTGPPPPWVALLGLISMAVGAVLLGVSRRVQA